MFKQDIINTLIAWIEQNLHQPLDLTAVAKKSGYSHWYIQRMFKTTTSISIGAYIRNRRLEKAAEELVQTTSTISSIAYNYWFDSQQSFSRAFKRYFNQSPMEYRQCIRKQQYYQAENRQNSSQTSCSVTPGYNIASLSLLAHQHIPTVTTSKTPIN